ncbi:MAG TPA: hypothetical protein VK879_17375 [Candidatus Sulfomarinibacteraceae bacterium]|nr:hypothetical protein [Candidatus Sulfomarinibacteraceae bacterium]
MSHLLLTPPIALLIYVVLAAILSLVGRQMAAQGIDEQLDKQSIYAGGELPPSRHAAPGYRPFFIIALFFAILHLGVLMLGSSGLTPISGLYLAGLLLALLALILG